MHSYASDSWTRGPRVYLLIGFLALSSVSAFKWFAGLPALGGVVDPAALTTAAAYGAFVWLFDRFLWAWFPDIPNLNGTWRGTVASSHNGTTTLHCVVRVRQTWTRIAIVLETENSISRTTIAALFSEQSGDEELKYEYLCEPKNSVAPTMHIHRGICTLRIHSDSQAMQGNYFTGPGRETKGMVELHRISRKRLAFRAALETNQE